MKSWISLATSSPRSSGREPQCAVDPGSDAGGEHPLPVDDHSRIDRDRAEERRASHGTTPSGWSPAGRRAARPRRSTKRPRADGDDEARPRRLPPQRRRGSPHPRNKRVLTPTPPGTTRTSSGGQASARVVVRCQHQPLDVAVTGGIDRRAGIDAVVVPGSVCARAPRRGRSGRAARHLRETAAKPICRWVSGAIMRVVALVDWTVRILTRAQMSGEICQITPQIPANLDSRLSMSSPFPAVQLLDVAGPLQVFASCQRSGHRRPKRPRPYAPAGGGDGRGSRHEHRPALPGWPLTVDPLRSQGCARRRYPVGRWRAWNGVYAAMPRMRRWSAAVRRPARGSAAARRLGLQRRLSARRRRALLEGRRCGDPLDALRRPRPPLSRCHRRRAGPDLRARRCPVEFGGHHGRHRPRAGACRGGSWPRGRRWRWRANWSCLPQASRRTGAVQRRPSRCKRPRTSSVRCTSWIDAQL